jgi:hypothetical protein
MNSDASFVPNMNPDEVSYVFTVPVSRFLSSYNYEYQDIAWYDQMWRHHLYGVPHLPDIKATTEYPVTGFTAAVLLHCAIIGIGSERSGIQEVTEIDPDETKSWEDLFITSLVQSGELEKRQKRSRRKHGSTRRGNRRRSLSRETRSREASDSSNSRI